ncbi:MAG TPA: Lrp/AsnC family transcriptional regulator [Streptosporangiaceae bacterium]|nr:Lrp/AsnC family transcriptional regulator [Streptosporangiaceae bacterium]
MATDDQPEPAPAAPDSPASPDAAGAAAGPLAELSTAVGTPLPPVPLDGVDRRLLALLAADARVSQRKLGRELSMSAPAVGVRLARLERAGVIRHYTVDIDWSAAGYPLLAYLAITATANLGGVLRAFHAIPEVEDVAVVAGSMDLLARVRLRDHAHLRTLMFEQVWKIPGVQRTETFLGLAEMPAKQFTRLLIEEQERLARDAP